MDYTNLKQRMEKSIGAYQEKLSEIRAGRANPAILNKIKVDYYGVPTPINQMAGISVPEARMIVIQPWDASILKEIEKAILASDIGLNPNNDGKLIRLVFPELTEERRKEIVKDVKKLCEETKIGIRNERKDVLEIFKAAEKDKKLTKDELENANNEVQKLVDKYNEMADQLAKKGLTSAFPYGIMFTEQNITEVFIMNICSTEDIRKKEIINLCDGSRLGFATDFEINVCDARITALIVPCGSWFNFGKNESIIIPWENIECIGEDAILIKMLEVEQCACAKGRIRKKHK